MRFNGSRIGVYKKLINIVRVKLMGMSREGIVAFCQGCYNLILTLAGKTQAQDIVLYTLAPDLIEGGTICSPG